MAQAEFLICGNPQQMNIIKKIETLPDLLKLRNDNSITKVGYTNKKGVKLITSKSLFDRWTNKPSIAQEYVERGVFMIGEPTMPKIKINEGVDLQEKPAIVEDFNFSDSSTVDKEYFESLKEERIPNQSFEEVYPDIEQDAIAAKKFNLVTRSIFVNAFFLIAIASVGVPTLKGVIQDGVYIYVIFALCAAWNLYTIIRYHSIK